MKKNKHLLLWASLGSLVLLAAAALQENVLRDWRRLQRAAATAERPVEVQLRQIVVPALHVADRCVTCHVGMAAGETGVPGDKVLAPHPKVGHDPAEYGCTTCHAGQGRATEAADAHGTILHWPEPMIPKRFVYAGCGACHTHLGIPQADELARAQTLFERYDCLACHKLDGRGGTLRPGEGLGMEGPDLSRAGATGYDRGWYAGHLRQRQKGGAWRAFEPIPQGDRAVLDDYLATRVGAPALVEAKALFNSLGCRGCHKVRGVGGDEGPDLTRVGQLDPGQRDFTNVPGDRTVANWLAQHFRAPAAVVPGSQMPALALSDTDIDLLNYYLLSLRRSGAPEAYWPGDRIRAERFGEREFRGDGASLFGAFCAACHGARGEGKRYAGATPFPAIGNPDFLAVASNAFIGATIQDGRPGRRMPGWKAGGLRPAEIEAVVAHLRSLDGGKGPEPDPRPARWAQGDAPAGQRLYAVTCAGCHGKAGEGGEGPALKNPVLLANATDTYLTETIRRGRRGTAMESFATPSPTRASLGSGEIESIVAFIRTWEKQPSAVSDRRSATGARP
jgi:mono/diheme cytochrome c family protein